MDVLELGPAMFSPEIQETEFSCLISEKVRKFELRKHLEEEKRLISLVFFDASVELTAWLLVRWQTTFLPKVVCGYSEFVENQ